MNSCGETLSGWLSMPKDKGDVKYKVDTHWMTCLYGVNGG